MELVSFRIKTELAGIQDVCRRQKSPALLWDEIRDMILHAVPGDLGMFGIMDPVTGLFVDGYSYGERPEDADTYISQFYLKQEHYSFLDLWADGVIISHPSRSTRGNLEKEPIYAEWLRPEGFKHGALIAFVSGNYYWGGLCIIRGDDVPDFNEQELAFLRCIVEPVGSALRTTVAWSQANASVAKEDDTVVRRTLPDSGVLMLDHQHRVLFRTEAVQSILNDIIASDMHEAPRPLHKVGDALPGVMHAVAARLWTAGQNGQKTNNPRVAVKGRSQWWTVTATMPEPSMSEEVATVLIISRSHPRDTAPVLLAVYGLTKREQEVVNWIRRGVSTEVIARHMCVSRYTVKDHLKNIFAKVGVRSRGELMACIFGEESSVGSLAANSVKSSISETG